MFSNFLHLKILDVACGTGVVGQELKDAGYDQVDGLDPSQGYLNGAMAKGIFRRVYKAFIDPDTPTSIPDCSYDAILCCAGFFQVRKQTYLCFHLGLEKGFI